MSLRPRLRARAAVLCALALAAIVTGCASRQLQRDGLSHIEERNYERGLALLAEAVAKEPGDASLRVSLHASRERVLGILLADARKAAAAGQRGEAQGHYARALAIAPKDPRITNGLLDLERSEAHAEAARQAGAALASGDLERAELLVQGILAADAANARALGLRARIAGARARESDDPKQLRPRLTSPVDLEFRDANIKMVLDVLSRTSGINFILDKEIKSDTKVTIYVRGVAVEDAIDLALVQSQLEKKILSDNTVLIYPNTPQKLREYQDLVIRTFYLVNSEAKQTASLLKTILKVKDMQVDDRLNMIVLRETADTIRLAEKLIRAQDLAEPEVILEVEVLEINRTRALELGMSWPDTFTWLSTDPANLTLGQLPFGQHVSRDRIGMNANLVLKARQDHGIANLLSNPRIRVKNREKARILVGDKVPIITATVTPGSVNPITTETITYLDVGLKLEAEPLVLLDGDVSIKIALEVSTLGDSVTTRSGSVAYRVGTRTASTSLRLRDGETQILMGLIRDEERRRASGVPGLMTLPVLGRLFSTPRDDTEKTEIALSITPRIVRNIRRPEARDMEFWSGTESTMRSRRTVLASAAPAVPSSAPPLAAPAVPTALPLAALRQDAAVAPAPAAVPPEPPARAAPPRPLQLAWSAPEGARVGEQVVVGMVAEAHSPFVGAALTLQYDPVALEVEKVEGGELLRQAGAKVRFNHAVDSSRGRIAISLARPGPGAAPGKGRLFDVTFRVKAPSTASRVQLTSMSPQGPDDAALPFSVDGPLTLSLRP